MGTVIFCAGGLVLFYHGEDAMVECCVRHEDVMNSVGDIEIEFSMDDVIFETTGRKFWRLRIVFRAFRFSV